MILLVFVAMLLFSLLNFGRDCGQSLWPLHARTLLTTILLIYFSRLLENVNDLLSSLVDAPPSFCSYKTISASKYVSPL